MRLALMSLLMISLVGCATKTREVPTAQVSAPLKPMNHEVLQWTHSTVCSTYIFSFRVREAGEEGSVKGHRKGILSAGSVIGGQPPDADSADALYGAILQHPDATYLLAPRYIVQSEGVFVLGTRPVFGRRCSKASARAIRVVDVAY